MKKTYLSGKKKRSLLSVGTSIGRTLTFERDIVRNLRTLSNATIWDDLSTLLYKYLLRTVKKRNTISHNRVI